MVKTLPFEDQARAWSYQRQLLGKQGETAAQALSDVVGVYSAHPSAPLSLYTRTRSMTAASFRALEAQRLAIRLPAMRGSIHLLPLETAPQIFSAFTMSQTLFLKRVQYAGLTPAEYAQFKQTVLKTVKKPTSVRALRETSGEAEARLGTLLRLMSAEGLVLRIGAPSLISNALEYVPTKAWLGHELTTVKTDEALAWLAGEYVRSFGPVRVQDFQWWVGITKRAAVKALAQVETVEIAAGYLLLKADADAYHAAKSPKDTIDLLPKWDAYAMGYAPDGRGRFIAPEFQNRIYDSRGDGVGVVLHNGFAIGAWDMRGSGSTLDIKLDLFELASAKLEKAIQAEFEAMAAFLENDTVGVQKHADANTGLGFRKPMRRKSTTAGE